MVTIIPPMWFRVEGLTIVLHNNLVSHQKVYGVHQVSFTLDRYVSTV